jgi:hypothetical protein
VPDFDPDADVRAIREMVRILEGRGQDDCRFSEELYEKLSLVSDQRAALQEELWEHWPVIEEIAAMNCSGHPVSYRPFDEAIAAMLAACKAELVRDQDGSVRRGAPGRGLE